MDETVDQRCAERPTTLKISGVRPDGAVGKHSAALIAEDASTTWWPSVLRLTCVEPRRSVNPESIAPFAR